MKISANFDVMRKKDGTIITTLNGVQKTEIDPTRIADATAIYEAVSKIKADARENWLNEKIAEGKFTSIFGKGASSVKECKAPDETAYEKARNGLQRLIDFCKEFEFEPNYRFVNTLSHKLKVSNENAKDYISCYFELTDSPYKNEIKAKTTSAEFRMILDDIKEIEPIKQVNNRFKIYYGSQGTGKTTLAQSESDGRCIVCNASMLPSDLMQDFGFNEGDAEFKDSILWRCMENGEPIVLDEINLLPFDSLRFLQGILDGKTEFNYKDKIVHIKEGFQIIGTMNLSVNGMVYGLPEPLVDRCFEMRKFALDAKTLVSAIM